MESQDLNKEQNQVLYVDALSNAIDYLESTSLFLDRNDNFKWKWIVLSLYQTFYSFCILNLEGTSPTEVIAQSNNEDDNTYVQKGNDKFLRSRKQYRGEHGKEIGCYQIVWEELSKVEWESNLPKTNKLNRKGQLIDFWTSVARVQDSEVYMARYMDSRSIQLSDEEWKSLEFINYYANKLTHFIPMSLGTHISTIKKCCKDLLRPLTALAFETHQVLYFNFEEKDKIKKLLVELESKLN